MSDEYLLADFVHLFSSVLDLQSSHSFYTTVLRDIILPVIFRMPNFGNTGSFFLNLIFFFFKYKFPFKSHV